MDSSARTGIPRTLPRMRQEVHARRYLLGSEHWHWPAHVQAMQHETGGDAMSRKPLIEGERTVSLTIRLPKALRSALRERGRETKLGSGEIIRRALAAFLAR